MGQELIAAVQDRRSGPVMRPFGEMPPEALRSVEYVLTDIDDTLTTDGRLPAAAYQALESLRESGIVVVPVTGRPAGWCDLIARLWPVDAVVGENGAFYFLCDGPRGMVRVFAKTPEERRADRAGLQNIAQAVLGEVPGARIAADQPFRETDLAVDFAEDGPRLSADEIGRIVACFTRAGATAKVSSIHVNGWYGGYDKLAMTRQLFRDRFSIDLDLAGGRVLYVGDSPNDEPMFGFFRNSVAVANFAGFARQVVDLPRWIANGSGGAGFAEVAQAILAARRG